MKLVLLVTFFIFFAICVVVYVKLTIQVEVMERVYFVIHFSI